MHTSPIKIQLVPKSKEQNWVCSYKQHSKERKSWRREDGTGKSNSFSSSSSSSCLLQRMCARYWVEIKQGMNGESPGDFYQLPETQNWANLCHGWGRASGNHNHLPAVPSFLHPCSLLQKPSTEEGFGRTAAMCQWQNMCLAHRILLWMQGSTCPCSSPKSSQRRMLACIKQANRGKKWLTCNIFVDESQFCFVFAVGKFLLK